MFTESRNKIIQLRLIPYLIIAALLLTSGCTVSGISAQNKLHKAQTISAGHTGCMPQDNVISDMTESLDSALWIAECKGERYLCSGYRLGNDDRVFNCAPAVE